MANDLNQSQYVGDDIDLKKIFKILLESKKLIISIVLIFTITSFIYSLSLKPSFITSTKLEIGYFEVDNGDRELIESPSNLISDLKVLIMKNPDNKFNQNVSMNSFEGKLINLKTTSSSAEQNENLLKEVIRHIDERHSKLVLLITKQKRGEISHEIDLSESEISFNISQNLLNLANVESAISFYKSQNLLNLANVESAISFLKENIRANIKIKISKLQSEISKLQSDLPILDQEISQLNQVVIEDTNNLNLLKSTTLSVERASNSPTLEQIISSYKSQINQLRRERNNSISEISILSQKLDNLKKNTLQSDNLYKLKEKKKALENYPDDLYKLEEKKKALENYDSQSYELFILGQRQKTLENQLKMLTSQTQIKTHLIENIATNTIKPNTQFIISLGIIFGFIMSIFLVIIINFVKSYREGQA